MILCTAQMRYSNPEMWVLDTTVKSSKTAVEKLFAPTWDLVMGSKRGELSWGEYTAGYLQLLRQRFHQNNAMFRLVMASEKPVVFKCYCAKGKNCHRLLLVDVFRKLCDDAHIPFEYRGELP